MFPNAYFPTSYFSVGYFTILATILVLPEFRSVSGTNLKNVKIKDTIVEVPYNDDEEVLDLIVMMFQMEIFNG